MGEITSEMVTQYMSQANKGGKLNAGIYALMVMGIEAKMHFTYTVGDEVCGLLVERVEFSGRLPPEARSSMDLVYKDANASSILWMQAMGKRCCWTLHADIIAAVLYGTEVAEKAEARILGAYDVE